MMAGFAVVALYAQPSNVEPYATRRLDWYDRRPDKDRYKRARIRRAARFAMSLLVKRHTSYRVAATAPHCFQPPRVHCGWRRPG